MWIVKKNIIHENNFILNCIEIFKKVLKEIQSLKEDINKKNKVDLDSTEDIIDKAADYLKTLQAIKATEEENASLKKTIKDFSEQINQSNVKLQEINTIISNISSKTAVINDIVFQTKLLSFNASVEAARAGDIC